VGEDEVVHLLPGERHHVTLPGLGTAGYVWSHEVVRGDDVADVVKEPGSSEVEANEDPRGEPVGQSRDEVFAITAKRSGTADVRFIQSRSWETAALRERTLRVIVAEG
jgi:predicted secreted protein